MATDGPTPPPCNKKLFRQGRCVLVAASISANRMEGWVKQIAAESGQLVDWHYSGGRARVLAMGDFPAVQAAIDAHIDELDQLERDSYVHSYGLDDTLKVTKANVQRFYPEVEPILWEHITKRFQGVA